MVDSPPIQAPEDDELIMVEDVEGQDVMVECNKKPWKLMVIDDDPSVHDLTKLVLRHYRFEDRGLELISGFSGAQARLLIAENPDTATMLLDVVMESETAGLEVVHFIRDVLKNGKVRIILRTGQPGQAPEQEIIFKYDINDYKDKTELTQQKLVTAVTASLRNYRDLVTIEMSKIGLEKIIDATGSLFEPRSLKKLATGVLTQLTSILGLDESAVFVKSSSFAATDEDGDLIVYAGTGKYEAMIGHKLSEMLPSQDLDLIQSVVDGEQSYHDARVYVGFFKSRFESKNILFLNVGRTLTAMDQDLIRIFFSNVGLAFDNVYLNQEIFHTQRDITFTLGELIEARTKDSGKHVWRVADSARLLGQKAGLTEEDVEMLWLASPLHDLGKIALPEQILNKPGGLSTEEWGMMQEHTSIGFQILKGSNRKILQVGATIAIQHHERWDGKGYPQGLKGEEIHIFARIIGLLDVFDALCHHSAFKKAWPMDRVLNFIREGRGKRFDPFIVDQFFKYLPEFLAIQEGVPNPGSAQVT